MNNEISKEIKENRNVLKSRFLETLKLINLNLIQEKMNRYCIENEKLEDSKIFLRNSGMNMSMASTSSEETNFQSFYVNNNNNTRNLFRFKIKKNLKDDF